MSYKSIIFDVVCDLERKWQRFMLKTKGMFYTYNDCAIDGHKVCANI